MVQTVDGPDTDALVDTIANQNFSWVAITSPESAYRFSNAWNKAGRPQVRIASVGGGTSRCLRMTSEHLTPAFVPSKANAITLAAELPDPTTGDTTVLYPASQRARNTLQRRLEDRGFHVTRLDTYNTEPVTSVDDETLELALACKVVAVAAPSALKAWVQLAGEDAAKARPLACIGSTSAEAALEMGWREEDVYWPEYPGLDGFVESIQYALEQQAARGGVDAQ